MAPNDTDETKILDQWTHNLTQALQILDLKVDQELILELARKSADSVTDAAGPITAFLVGYAAALEAGTGSAGSKAASTASITKAADVALRLCGDARPQENPQPEPGAKGWTQSAQ